MWPQENKPSCLFTCARKCDIARLTRYRQVCVNMHCGLRSADTVCIQNFFLPALNNHSYFKDGYYTQTGKSNTYELNIGLCLKENSGLSSIRDKLTDWKPIELFGCIHGDLTYWTAGYTCLYEYNVNNQTGSTIYKRKHSIQIHQREETELFYYTPFQCHQVVI